MDEFINLKETELRLGLPGTDNVCKGQEIVSCCNNSHKRASPSGSENEIELSTRKPETSAPRKAQIVGWPPVRSYRKNNIQTKKNESDHEVQGSYVKVIMDGAPYIEENRSELLHRILRIAQRFRSDVQILCGRPEPN